MPGSVFEEQQCLRFGSDLLQQVPQRRDICWTGLWFRLSNSNLFALWFFLAHERFHVNGDLKSLGLSAAFQEVLVLCPHEELQELVPSSHWGKAGGNVFFDPKVDEG